MDKAEQPTITQELLPCPFCGAEFKVSQEPHDNHPVGGLWYLFHAYGEIGSSARKCLIAVPKHFDTKDEAIAAWNTRTTSLAAHDGLVAEIERQEGLAKTYRGAQLRAEEKLCREQANAQGWKRRAEMLESKLAALSAIKEQRHD